MKTWKKVLLGAGLGFTVAKKIQALNEKRSLGSLLVEDLLRCAPAIPDQQQPENFKASFIKSSQPYELPKSVQKIYPFQPLAAFTDTWMLNNLNKPDQQFIFYLHGGAYWSQPNFFHYRLLNQLAKKLNAGIVLPIYPKAPAFQAEDVHDMVMARYLYLIENMGILSKNMTLVGDSAGAGLALSFLQVLRDQGLPLPNQAILLSPWLDIATNNPQMPAIQPHDPLLVMEDLTFAGATYAGNLDCHDPLVSPLYGDLTGLPPVAVFCGTHDIFYADVLKYSDIASEQNLNADFYIYPKMDHVFSLYPIPEAKKSLQQIMDIIQKNA